jgi:hypothetical protein
MSGKNGINNQSNESKSINNDNDFQNYFSRRARGNSKTPSSYCFNPITGQMLNK